MRGSQRVPRKHHRCRQVAAKMGESFDALTMAAEASKTTYEDQARTISTLTATNAELTVSVKISWTKLSRFLKS